jgi:hypothetical protein
MDLQGRRANGYKWGSPFKYIKVGLTSAVVPIIVEGYTGDQW